MYNTFAQGTAGSFVFLTEKLHSKPKLSLDCWISSHSRAFTCRLLVWIWYRSLMPETHYEHQKTSGSSFGSYSTAVPREQWPRQKSWTISPSLLVANSRSQLGNTGSCKKKNHVLTSTACESWWTVTLLSTWTGLRQTSKNTQWFVPAHLQPSQTGMS